MKKLLIGTAVAALAFGLTAPANAQVKLDLGGHFKGYGAWTDQDDTFAGPDVRNLDILRETEIHFTGETTLDSGLTVGFHTEADIDGASNGDSFDTEESYAYFSGVWGRVNFGMEDGAGYLLQVAAPSADANVDGIRQYISPINNSTDIFSLGDVVQDRDGSGTLTADDVVAGTSITALTLDYDMAISGADNKFTYLTPVFSGFQAGVSYTPEMGADSRGENGNSLDDETSVTGNYGDVWELAARYEGQFGDLGMALGAGYQHASLEADSVVGTGSTLFIDADTSGTFTAGDTSFVDDREAWNVGLDLNWGPFGLGGGYSEDDLGLDGEADAQTWVVGVDYTTGPFKLGATYINQDVDTVYEADRWTGGVNYTYGPGMTFRGSISYANYDVDSAAGDIDATSILLGTQIDF